MDILLLEDDPNLGETLSEDLTEAGYSVEWIADAETAAACTYEHAYRCYLFDVNVPGMSGFELLKGLRDAGDETPAIFITARGGMADVREGFDAGATDYLSKPFRMEELLIRLDARLQTPSHLGIGKNGWLDPKTLTLCIEGRETVLPKKECEILHYFLTHRERIVGKDEIEEILYEGETIADATFRVYIRQINAHLNPAARLVNIRGVGYRYEST